MGLRGHANMRRAALFAVTALLFGTAVFLLSLNGCGGGSATFIAPPPPTSKIQHVVIIFQENRTPDNLFQDQKLISNGADIQNFGVNSTGQTIPLSQIDLGTAGSNPDNYDLSHAHSAFVSMYDNGKMDGADPIPSSCATGVTNCAPANPQFMYVNPADVQPYFQMAEQYVFADRMFQTNQGPSFPAHQFIISGTSAPAVGSNLFVAENPTGVKNADSFTGCAAPAGETVSVIDPTGSELNNPPIYPCLEHPTLTDLLDTAKITWRYYAPSAGSIWTGPNAIQHMCGPNATPPNATQCVDGYVTESSAESNPEQRPDSLRHREQSPGTGELGDSRWAGFRPCTQQQRLRPILGDFNRGRYREQSLLVEHCNLHCVGRLGRMVRPCAATADS